MVSHWRDPSLLILNTSCQVCVTPRASSDNDISYFSLSLLLFSSLSTSLSLSSLGLYHKTFPSSSFWSLVATANIQISSWERSCSFLFTIPPSLSLSLTYTHLHQAHKMAQFTSGWPTQGRKWQCWMEVTLALPTVPSLILNSWWWLVHAPAWCVYMWSCDDHVVMWWSCDGHVMVMWYFIARLSRESKNEPGIHCLCMHVTVLLHACSSEGEEDEAHQQWIHASSFFTPPWEHHCLLGYNVHLVNIVLSAGVLATQYWRLANQQQYE